MKIRMVKRRDGIYGIFFGDEAIGFYIKKNAKNIYRSLTGRRGARDRKLSRFYVRDELALRAAMLAAHTARKEPT